MDRLTVNDLNKVCYDPWELCGMDNYCKKGCHEEGGCTKGCHILKMYRKLAEYEDLEEQGKLLKLPCAVGDTVYTACSWGIESGVVGSVEIISDRIFVNNIHGQMIGEAGNIFLTKSAAEQALKEMEGKNGN